MLVVGQISLMVNFPIKNINKYLLVWKNLQEEYWTRHKIFITRGMSRKSVPFPNVTAVALASLLHACATITLICENTAVYNVYFLQGNCKSHRVQSYIFHSFLNARNWKPTAVQRQIFVVCTYIYIQHFQLSFNFTHIKINIR